MTRRSGWVLGLMIVLAASPAFAQRQGRGGGRGGFGGMRGFTGPLALIGNEAVQEELSLSDEQKTKVEEIQQNYREASREAFSGFGDLTPEERQERMAEVRESGEKLAAEYEPKVKEVLDEAQNERLQQISLQVQGASALMNKEVVAALSLSEDQQKKLGEISKNFEEAQQEARRGGNFDFRDAMEKREKRDEELMAVLTDEQKTKLEEMKGEEFDLAQLRRGFGGGRGQGGGRRGNGGNRPEA